MAAAAGSHLHRCSSESSSASEAGLEEPIPARRIVAKLCAAGEALVPGVQDLVQADAAEACLLQAVLDFEWLPELLPQPLEPESAEREVIEPVLGVKGGELLG